MTDALGSARRKMIATGITAVLLTGLLIGGPSGLAIVSGDGGTPESDVGYGYDSETPTTTPGTPSDGDGANTTTPTTETTTTTVTDRTTSETTPGFTTLTGVVALVALMALAALRRR